MCIDNINCNCTCNKCITYQCCCPSCEIEDDGCLTQTPLSCTNYSGDDIVCGDLSITQADTGDEVVKKITDQLCIISEGLEDKFVKARVSDTTGSYLYDKLAGSDYINISVLNTNLNEKLKIDVKINALVAYILSQVPADKYVKISSTDTTSNYLISKLNSTTGISITQQNIGANESLRISIQLSQADGNIITFNGDGLYVPTPPTFTETTLIADDSSTIDFTQSGVAGHTLTALAKISAQAGNVLIDNVGLYVGFADSTTIDFSSAGSGTATRFTGDVKISSVAGNALVNNLGLYVSVPDPITFQDTVTIGFAQSDEGATTAYVKISTVEGNRIAINEGLYVGPETAETPLVANNSSTVNFSQSGTAGHTLTASVKLSTLPGNRLLDNSGLYVAPITDYYPILGLQTFGSLTKNGWFRLAKEDPNNPFFGVGEFGSGASGFASFEGFANGWAILAQDGINTITEQKFDIYGALKNPSGGFYPPSRIYHSDNLIAGSNVTFTPNADGQIVVSSSGSSGSTGVLGSVNRVSKFVTTTSIGDGIMLDDGSGIGIQVAPESGYSLKVNGNIKFTGKSVSPIQNLVYASTTVWNMDQGENAILTLTGNTTLSIINAVAGSFGIIEVRQDTSGGRTMAFPVGSTGAGGMGNIALTFTANAVDILGFFYNGTSFRWKKDPNHS